MVNSDLPSVTHVQWHGYWGPSNMGRLRIDLSPPHWGWQPGFENWEARGRAASLGCGTKRQEKGGFGVFNLPRTPLKPEGTYNFVMLSEVYAASIFVCFCLRHQLPSLCRLNPNLGLTPPSLPTSPAGAFLQGEPRPLQARLSTGSQANFTPEEAL